MRRFVAAVAPCISVLAVAQPALAEGTWNSYFSAGLTGKDTRTWTDNNTDAAGTVTSFRYCKYYNNVPTGLRNIQVQLTYENTFTPDENMGQVIYNCNTAVWQQYNYGRVKQGKYHETLIYVDGTPTPPNRVDVGTSTIPGILVGY